MTKFKIAMTIILSILLITLSCGGVCLAFADTENDVQTSTQETIDPNISLNESDLEGLADSFTEYLKAKYGADYEFYYNQIIEQWGSIEGYLLSFGSKLPEDYQSGWNIFVGWLRDYWPVWASPLALILVTVIAVVGKKTLNKIIEKIVNVKLMPIAKEMNAQSTALISLSRGQRALLGNNEKFAGTVKELEDCEKELKNE